MSEESKRVPRKGTGNYQEFPSLIGSRVYPEWHPDFDESRHPFVDRMISVESKLDHLTRCFREKDMSSFKTVVLDNTEFTALFKISGKTAQNWRDEGLIEYSQVKGKIY